VNGRILASIEICINSENVSIVRQAVEAAYLGGATTIELCRAMNLDGLTPRRPHINAARDIFQQRPGLMVMIRPRPGDFVYKRREITTMLHQIETAAECGADGVVFGVLRADDQRVARGLLQLLVAACVRYGLRSTFHRAFDATPDPIEALNVLIDCGVDRVLTAGIPWGQKGTALDGLDRLASLVRRANSRIEVVVGGGVNPTNVSQLLKRLPGSVSLHAYSGAQRNGRTTVDAVQRLVQAALA
jgi:copper homeostasis protein